MATIVVSTQANGFLNPGIHSMELGKNSELVAVVRKSGGSLGLFNSTNNGTSWTDMGVDISRSGLQDWSGIDIDEDNHIHIAYRVHESGKDRVFYRRWRRSGSTYVLESEVLVREATAAVAGDVYGGSDVLHLRIADNYWHVAVATGYQGAPSFGTVLSGMTVKKSSGTWTTKLANGTVFSGNRTFTHTGSGKTQPSLQRSATPTPHLYLTYGRGGVYVARLSWNASTKRWVGPTGDKLLGSNTTSMDFATSKFDGARLLVPILNGTSVTVAERNSGNTSQTDRTTPAHTTGVVRRVAITVDTNTGNFRVFAIGTSSGVVYYVDYTRATSTWGTWVSTGVTPVNIDCWGLRSKRGVHTDNTAGYDFYYATTTGSNTYAHTRYTVSYPPNTPAWNTNPGARRFNAALNLSWAFSDIDPADTQSAYALSRQIGTGTLSYWRASDSTWQATEQKNVSPINSVNVPSGWSVDADPAYTFKVKTWDSADLQSSYSEGLAIVPSTLQTVTISSPADLSTWIYRYLSVTWSMTDQASWRVSVFRNDGSTLPIHDSGWQPGTDTTYTTPPIFETGTGTFGYYVNVEAKNSEGLAGVTDTATLTVDFVTPPVPTLVVTPNTSNGTIDVQITNPVPAGLEPALLYNDLYRRVVGDTSDGLRMGTGLPDDALYQDYEAASGVDYEYRVQAIGVNETFIYSAWTD